MKSPLRTFLLLAVLPCSTVLATHAQDTMSTLPSHHDSPGGTEAQQRESSLSDAEVEILRNTADSPPERLQAFMGFVDERAKSIEKTAAGKRKRGREQDIHDLMQQIADIAQDLDDNLDDYSKRHKDVQNILPKLQAATERWATSVRTPADDETYRLTRTLALESIDDIQTAVKEMIPEQKAYFLAHPPGQQSKNEREQPGEKK